MRAFGFAPLFFMTAALAAQETIHLPAFSAEVAVSGQALHLPVAITVEPAPGTLHILVQTGLGDLQRNIVAILASAVNQDNRCGERLAVRDATLELDEPAANLSADVHVERWGCAKAFGKEVTKRLVNGDAALRIRLTPRVVDGRSVGLTAEVISIDAEGQLGEILRSPGVGGPLREKIRSSVESALGKAADLHGDLPPAVRDIVRLREARFGRREDMLALEVLADADIASEDGAPMVEALKKYRH